MSTGKDQGQGRQREREIISRRLQEYCRRLRDEQPGDGLRQVLQQIQGGEEI